MSDGPTDWLDKLSVLEMRYCEAYAGDACGNGVKACELAGFNGTYGTLATTSYRLLRKPEIREYLAALQENDPLVPGRVERLRFLGKVMRGEETEKRPERDAEGNVALVDCPPSLKDRLAAQEALSKLAGEQVTKVAQTDSAGNDVKSLSNAELMALVALGKGIE